MRKALVATFLGIVVGEAVGAIVASVIGHNPFAGASIGAIVAVTTAAVVVYRASHPEARLSNLDVRQAVSKATPSELRSMLLTACAVGVLSIAYLTHVFPSPNSGISLTLGIMCAAFALFVGVPTIGALLRRQH